MARRGRDNFRFTTVELTALALSFTATSVLVFLLGFYVGRRVAAEHAAVGENVARVPVGAPPSDDVPFGAASRPAPGPSASSSGTHAEAPTPQRAPAVAKPEAAAAQVPKAAAPAQPASPAQPRPAPQAAPGVPYTVQVLATRNKNEAETLTNNLKRRGLGAYLVQVDDAGGSWYRVRIGNYDSPDAARRTADRAAKELGLTQAYVVPLTSGSR